MFTRIKDTIQYDELRPDILSDVRDPRRTVDRPILGDHFLNVPSKGQNIHRKPSATRIPSLSQVSFFSTSTKQPPNLPQRSPGRLSAANGTRRIPHRTSASTDLKERYGRKPDPLSSPKLPANHPSHLISPPSTTVSRASIAALKRNYTRPHDHSIVNSALTTNSLTPSASASQIPSRPASSQNHSPDISSPPLKDTQQPVPTRPQQHSNQSYFRLHPTSVSLKYDERRANQTSQISDLTIPSTVRKLDVTPHHFHPNGVPIDLSCRPQSSQSGAPVRLDTSGLPPQTHPTPHGHITILKDTCDLVVDLRESERRSGRSGNEVLKITSDGRMVSLHTFS